MKRKLVVRLLLAAILVVFIAGLAHAADYQAGNLRIEQPWSRATPKGATTGSGYLRITNDGPEADRLVAASIDAAKNVQFHATIMQGGVAQMRPLANVEIPPGQTIEFKPGASHLMFMDLNDALKQGEKLQGTLTFERAGTVKIEFDVEGVGAQSTSPGAHGH
jgi:periplasmic copper chaperone A